MLKRFLTFNESSYHPLACLSSRPLISSLRSFYPRHPVHADEEAITGAGQQKLDELAQNMQEQQQRKSTAQEEEVVNPRKEKSVLQTKLTKLAIQIGYGGRRSLSLSDSIFCLIWLITQNHSHHSLSSRFRCRRFYRTYFDSTICN